MYIPANNRMTDPDEILSFIERFSFGTLISTAAGGVPVATHLPFLVKCEAGQLVLTSHFAKANPQWQQIENNGKILVIFQEPHAYISPFHYEKELNVPTWNYIAVHVYGTGSLITEQNAVYEVLDQTVARYEQAYKTRYDQLPQDFKFKMSQGIVAFRIYGTDIQAKKKLSQNKTKNEQEQIIQSLSASKDTTEQLVAAYMQRNLDAH
ncbi:FMN-binding negative transcriptional regulator [Niabella drilacis]|uniref:Negative transcriptional regulator, PaiB family n=1 Tax=Niabella drilacis (strain DSM 25811 / CCM 8410 / CCUG 62505 / LMG 26954 / E90) TaxID=1285928 RepID=A0A1G6KZH7_NIADE|nr:FMN-binding negative transcriptional regulator [Niabella drilacis]SDC36231.1 negative transcriptional regulator, PaiB family [Niabella drilacis]